MALFVEPAPAAEAADGLARQLEPIRDHFPGARVRVAGPGEPPELLSERWRVVVEADGDTDALKQECLELLGE